MRTRIAPLTLAAALLAGAAATVTTTSAVATESGAASVQADCYASARNYTSAPGSGSSNAHWPGTGIWAYTTSNCADINLKVNATREVRTCFKATGSCNGWRWARAGQWALAASDVKDGSGFYIQFKGTSRSTGLIAY